MPVCKILAITKDADYLQNPAKQAQVREDIIIFFKKKTH